MRLTQCYKHLLAFIGIFTYGSFIFAHNVPYSNLDGLPLCIDSRSVQVLLDSRIVDHDYHKDLIHSRLRATLVSTFKTYQIPFKIKEFCTDNSSFIYTFLSTNYIPQDNPEPSLVYTASLQVGLGPVELPTNPKFFLENNRFELYSAERLFLSELTDSFYILLPEINEEMIGKLADSWWEDFLEKQNARRSLRLRLIFLSLGFTGLILIGGWALLLRRNNI